MKTARPRFQTIDVRKGQQLAHLGPGRSSQRRGGAVLRLLIVLIVLAVIGGGGYYLWNSIASTGAGRLEQYVGNAISDVIDAHLNPEFRFQTLDYQAPRTVTVSDISLVEAGTPIMTATTLRLELAEIPQIGRPIKIQNVFVERPQLQIITTDDGILGWSNLVPQEVVEDPNAVPEGKRLSDVLQMRNVTITDAELVYEEAGLPDSVMRLSNVDFALDTPPLSPGGGEPGWYVLDSVLQREGLFSLQIDGAVNLDTLLLRMNEVLLQTTLDEERYSILPPQLQEILREYDIRGALEARVSGEVPVEEFMTGSQLNLELLLTNALASFSEYTFPVDEIQVTSTLQNGLVNAEYRAFMLDGSAQGQAQVNLTTDSTSAGEIVATWNVSEIQLQETLRTLQPDQLPKYAGVLSTSGQAQTNMDDVLAAIDGDGSVSVRDGRLVLLPVISGLVKEVGEKPKEEGEQRRFRDEADITFELTSDAVEATEITIVSPLVAARGDGEIYYDRRLDLRLNAGPLERIQEGLGKIGGIFGAISDRLVTYHVTGTLEEPKIGVKPLGLGARKQAKERDQEATEDGENAEEGAGEDTEEWRPRFDDGF